MIHWCGTGLSAVPGLRRLIENGHDVMVWNRTETKAREAVGDLTNRILAFAPEAVESAVQPGDVVEVEVGGIGTLRNTVEDEVA